MSEQPNGNGTKPGRVESRITTGNLITMASILGVGLISWRPALSRIGLAHPTGRCRRTQLWRKRWRRNEQGQVRALPPQDGHLMSQGDEFEFQGEATTNPKREQRT